jgi:hypothetical protein
MGEKKQKEAMKKRAMQVLVVGACVLFVVLMVLSGMGSHWLTLFTVVKPGDTVVVDYTFYDANGNPLLTTNQQTYTQLVSKEKNIIYSKQLSMVVGQNLTTSLYPVQIYTSGSWSTQKFAIFSMEYNAIDQAIVGMKTGDQKRIQLSTASMSQEWSAAQLARNGVNMSDINQGDILAMGVSDNPEDTLANTSATYTRVAEITSKTADGVVADFGYPAVDISIYSINGNN